MAKQKSRNYFDEWTTRAKEHPALAIGMIIVIVVGTMFAAGNQVRDFVRPIPDASLPTSTGIEERRSGSFRVLLPTDREEAYLALSPSELMRSVDGMTGVQAADLIESRYRGKTVRLEGRLADVHPSVGGARVVLQGQPTTRFTVTDSTARSISHLRPGDPIVLEGTVGSIDQIGVDFVDGVVLR